MCFQIRNIKLLENETEIPSLMFSKQYTVSIHYPKQPDNLMTASKDSSSQSSHMTEIHNIIGVPVSVFDVKASAGLLAVAVGSYMHGTGGDWFKVRESILTSSTK